jgi:hypothetical protein
VHAGRRVRTGPRYAHGYPHGNTLEWALIPRGSDQTRSSVRRRSCSSALRSCSSAVRLCSSAVEGAQAAFGHGRRDAQIPVLGDQTGQVEFPGEADPDHARPPFQRGDSVRAEGAIVEAAPVAQAGAVGTEAEGGNEDEVETDLLREQLCGAEQLGVLVRLPDAPPALRLQARHRSGDPPESQRSADLSDHGQIDGPSGGEESVECGVEVRFSRQRRIGEKGPDRARADEVPRRRGHGSGARLGGGGEQGRRGCRRTGTRLGAGRVRASRTDARSQLRLRSSWIHAPQPIRRREIR